MISVSATRVSFCGTVPRTALGGHMVPQGCVGVCVCACECAIPLAGCDPPRTKLDQAKTQAKTIMSNV